MSKWNSIRSIPTQHFLSSSHFTAISFVTLSNIINAMAFPLAHLQLNEKYRWGKKKTLRLISVAFWRVFFCCSVASPCNLLKTLSTTLNAKLFMFKIFRGNRRWTAYAVYYWNKIFFNHIPNALLVLHIVQVPNAVWFIAFHWYTHSFFSSSIVCLFVVLTHTHIHTHITLIVVQFVHKQFPLFHIVFDSPIFSFHSIL